MHPSRSATACKRAAVESAGDLHMAIAQVTAATSGARTLVCEADGKDVECNLFQMTRRLLQGTALPDAWTAAAYNHDVGSFGSHPQLVFHNYPELTDDLHTLSRYSDSISLAACRPDVHMHQMAMCMSGSATRQNTPLRFPRRSTDPRPTLETRDELWMPALLRHRQS